jgi:hypothetical protein
VTPDMMKSYAAVGHYDRAAHAVWMCREIPLLVDNGAVDKACRWLGFVHCYVAWSLGVITGNEQG